MFLSALLFFLFITTHVGVLYLSYPVLKTIFVGLTTGLEFLMTGLVVVRVTFFVFLYILYYMQHDTHVVYFSSVVVLFVSSMLILTLSNSVFFLFLG